MRTVIPLSLSLLILCGIGYIYAQEAPPPSLYTTEEILEHIQAKAKVLESLSASFHQRKFTRLLVAPMESEGRLYWVPPDRFLWEVSSPTPLSLVARGDKMLVVYPDLKRASLYRHPMGSSLLEEITGATGDPEAFQRQYLIQTANSSGPKSDKWVQLILTPRSARRARYLKRVEVIIDPNNWLPQTVIISESDEDKTTIHLSQILENAKLPDGLFNIKPPEGFHLQRFQDGGRP